MYVSVVGNYPNNMNPDRLVGVNLSYLKWMVGGFRRAWKAFVRTRDTGYRSDIAVTFMGCRRIGFVYNLLGLILVRLHIPEE